MSALTATATINGRKYIAKMKYHNESWTPSSIICCELLSSYNIVVHLSVLVVDVLSVESLAVTSVRD